MTTACADCTELDELAGVLGDTEQVRRVVAQHLQVHALRDEAERLQREVEAQQRQIVTNEAALAPHYGSMRVTPERVAQATSDWLSDRGEWPHPWEMHESLADWAGCPTEVAAFDVLNALNLGEVYGLPSIVAMRLGEAFGDWREADPLPYWDNGFRIAVLTEPA